MKKFHINLVEGDVISFWSDDAIDGVNDNIVGKGSLFFNPKRSAWCLEISESNLHHESEFKK
jgi:hypothetical protein